MNDKFLKTIAIASTIVMTLLGGNMAAKAMWESLDETQRDTIRYNHVRSLQAFPKKSEQYVIQQCRALEQGSHTYVSPHVGNCGYQECMVQYKSSNTIDPEVKSCPECQHAVTAVYCTTVVPKLQQQLAATLLEVDGLKDDVQRLRAELRAATEPR